MPTLRWPLPCYRFRGCEHKYEFKLSDDDRSFINNTPGLFKEDGYASNDITFLNESHNALWEKFFNEPVYASGPSGSEGPLRTRKDRVYDLFQTLKRHEDYLSSLREPAGGMGSNQEETVSSHINLVRRNIVDILSEYVVLSDVYVWVKELNGVSESRAERTQAALKRMMRYGKYRSRRSTNEFMEIVKDGKSSVGRERKVYIDKDNFDLVWED